MVVDMENNKNFKKSIVKLGKNIAIKNKKMTCESDILQCFTSPYSATIVEILENANINYEHVQNDYELDRKSVV